MSTNDHMASPWEQVMARASAADTPDPTLQPADWDPLVPNVDLPLGHTTTYQTVSITTLPELPGKGVEIDGPLDVLQTQQPRASAPAEGVLLTHEQAWRMKGVTLGRLLHSMCLAPGEVSQIAVTEWNRRTRGKTAEQVAEDEHVSQAAGREREIHDVTKATADQSGFGLSTSSVRSGQSGASLGGLTSLLFGSMSASGNASSSSVSSFNVGSRSVSSDSNNSVRQATRQSAANVRGRRAAIVQEVSQSETEQFQTRVVANYNHAHALNMLYFEALQAYELSTRVTDAQRCLFLPMQEIDFTKKQNIATFSGQLAQGARAMGHFQLAKALELLDQANNRAKLAADRAKNELLRKEHSVTKIRRELTGLRNDRQMLADQLMEHEDQLAQLQVTMNRLSSHGHDIWKSIEGAVENIEEVFRGISLKVAKLKNEITGIRTAMMHLANRIAYQEQAIHSVEAATLNARETLRQTEGAAAHVDDDIVHQLNAQHLLFNQAIWAQLSSAQIAAMVGDKEHNGLNLASTLDPNPIAIVGNYVGYKWPFPETQKAAAAAFLAEHLKDDDDSAERDVVVLPTGGIFAEAVPGQANSAEKLDLTRFWKWDKDTIPILPTQIERLQHVARAQRKAATPGTLGKASVKIKDLPQAPTAPTHPLAGVIGTSLFRDLSGSNVIENLMSEAQKFTGEEAVEAQKRAHEEINALLDHLETMVPQVTDFLEKQGKTNKNSGASTAEDAEATESGEDANVIGGLKNALGAGKEGLDVEGLLSTAAELGMFL